MTLEANTGGVYLGDARYQLLLADLDARAAVVLLHPTSPVRHEYVALGRPWPMLEFIFETARMVSELLLNGAFRRYSNIRWIVPHGGGVLALLADRVELFRLVFGPADPDGQPVAEQLRRLWYEAAGTPFPRQLPALAGLVGDTRIVYGSDFCWNPAPAPLVDRQLAAIDAATREDGASWQEVSRATRRRWPVPRRPVSADGSAVTWPPEVCL